MKPISKRAAEVIFNDDYNDAVKAVQEYLNPEWLNCNDVRQDVLIDMTFNMGIFGVLKFRKMREAIRQENWQKAHDEILNSKYARIDDPKRAKRNAMRMLTGERN